MKNKLSKGLSLSANPERLIKGAFSAVQHVFAGFSRKNDIFGNNTVRSNITASHFTLPSLRAKRSNPATSPREGEVGALLRVRGNKNITTGTKAESPAPVILGRDAQSVHRILWLRVSNLVNKFALLLHKCRGRRLSTFCMFFKYPSPDAKASPSPSRGEGYGLLRRCTPRNDAVTNGEGLHSPWCDKILGTDCESRPRMTGGRGAGFIRLLRRYTPRNDVCSVGRSMIEMLGVLTIIGVLSVGGIAGYSKAMEKWKLDKAIGDYSMMIQGILEHREDFLRQSHEIETFSLTVTDTLQALNLVPANWQRVGNRYLVDSMGNQIDVLIAPALYDMPDRIYINILLGGIHTNEENYFTEGFSAKLCTTLYTDLIIPLQNSIWKTVVYRKNSGNPPAWGGSSYCTKDEKCLSNMTLKDIHELCSSCNGKNEVCGVDFNII